MSAALLLMAAAISCPSFIKTKQQVSGQYGEGWQVRVFEPDLRLTEANIYEGHPSLRQVLMGDNGKEGQQWSLKAGEYWIECWYDDTSLRLIRRIEGPVICTAKPGDAHTYKPAAFSCVKN